MMYMHYIIYTYQKPTKYYEENKDFFMEWMLVHSDAPVRDPKGQTLRRIARCWWDVDVWSVAWWNSKPVPLRSTGQLCHKKLPTEPCENKGAGFVLQALKPRVCSFTNLETQDSNPFQIQKHFVQTFNSTHETFFVNPFSILSC